MSELINLIGDFQTTDVDPAKSKINFSTLSQLKGIFEPTNQLSETDIDLDLANLLGGSQFYIKKTSGLKRVSGNRKIRYRIRIFKSLSSRTF